MRGILAGVWIGIACVLYGIIVSLTGLKILGALVFPLGIYMILIKKYKLFTGELMNIGYNNTGDLAIIYTQNFIGIEIVYLLTRWINPNIFNTFVMSRNSHNSLYIIISGILCILLVLLGIQLYKGYYSVVGLWCCISLFVYLGFDHCVANMYYLSYNFSLYRLLILSTLGNIIGSLLYKKLKKKDTE